MEASKYEINKKSLNRREKMINAIMIILITFNNWLHNMISPPSLSFWKRNKNPQEKSHCISTNNCMQMEGSKKRLRIYLFTFLRNEAPLQFFLFTIQEWDWACASPYTFSQRLCRWLLFWWAGIVFFFFLVISWVLGWELFGK